MRKAFKPSYFFHRSLWSIFSRLDFLIFDVQPYFFSFLFFCRSLYLNYERDDSQFDIKLYRYTTRAELFENHTANPANAAFCAPDGKCYGSGLLPVLQ